MKAILTAEKQVIIKAENYAEAFALKSIFPLADLCGKCGQPLIGDRIIIDASVLESVRWEEDCG